MNEDRVKLSVMTTLYRSAAYIGELRTRRPGFPLEVDLEELSEWLEADDHTPVRVPR